MGEHDEFGLGCIYDLIGSLYGEGNGNPLQYSCLGNPVDREPGGLLSMGSQSRTQLEKLTETC